MLLEQSSDCIVLSIEKPTRENSTLLKDPLEGKSGQRKQ